jgi:hypothetical protein
MTFRQFAVFLIRLQAVWLLFYAVEYSTYLHSYWTALDRYKPGFPGYTDARHTFVWAILRIALHVGGAIICIRWPDRIVSWLVKDVIPQSPANTSMAPTAIGAGRSTDAGNDSSRCGSAFGRQPD